MQTKISGWLTVLVAATLVGCSSSDEDGARSVAETVQPKLTPLGPAADTDDSDEPTPYERRQAWITRVPEKRGSDTKQTGTSDGATTSSTQ